MIEVRVGRLAQAFGVHRNTVSNWIRSGKLPATATVGKKYLVDETGLRDFCRRHHVPAAAVDALTAAAAVAAPVAPAPQPPTPRREVPMSREPLGSVLVVGGGIAGIQATLDLAESGYFVHMVEKTAGIGGVMAQLDKTYPTNDCAM